jgi:gamma-glutamyltranspeptidase/glutathione hydrolase
MILPRKLTSLCAPLALALLLLGRAALAGTEGMVVASQADAARAGAAMLDAGGNAVDAAVATAFALAVTQPFSAGLGGGAFALVRLSDGSSQALDARETAPAAASRDMYLRPGVAADASLRGGLAVATPGFVRGMALLLERWGTLPLSRVLAPAIRLAKQGFRIGPYHARMLRHMGKTGLLEAFPETGRIQLPPSAAEAASGWVLRQEDLAGTLRRLAEQGPEAFHAGEIAQRIVAEVRRSGGILSVEDLAGYRPRLREPVTGSYRGFRVISFPPPSSGGAVLIEILNVLEGWKLAGSDSLDPGGVHRTVEAMKLAFADRARWFGDPDFVEVPVGRLTSKPYAEELRRRIEPAGPGGRALDVQAPGLRADDSGTTHLSTWDAAGNAVALTMTINTPFGSGITVPGTGIVLNNEMDDFSKAPGEPNVYGLVDERGANAIAPGKRPLSSMTPTVLTRDGKIFMVTGSPGGPRIISTTLHTILNVVDYGMEVGQAVAAPRYHHQWLPNRVFAEPELPASLVESLRGRGHQVAVSERTWSSAQSIVVDPATGVASGGSDPRGDGAAAGRGAPGKRGSARSAPKASGEREAAASPPQAPPDPGKRGSARSAPKASGEREAAASPPQAPPD